MIYLRFLSNNLPFVRFVSLMVFRGIICLLAFKTGNMLGIPWSVRIVFFLNIKDDSTLVRIHDDVALVHLGQMLASLKNPSLDYWRLCWIDLGLFLVMILSYRRKMRLYCNLCWFNILQQFFNFVIGSHIISTLVLINLQSSNHKS